MPIHLIPLLKLKLRQLQHFLKNVARLQLFHLQILQKSQKKLMILHSQRLPLHQFVNFLYTAERICLPKHLIQLLILLLLFNRNKINHIIQVASLFSIRGRDVFGNLDTFGDNLDSLGDNLDTFCRNLDSFFNNLDTSNFLNKFLLTFNQL